MSQEHNNTSQSAPDEPRENGACRDPFLEEVRALKHAASERAGHDINRLCEQLKEIEKTMPNPRAKKPELGQV